VNPERLRELLEYLPAAILEIDGDGRIVLLNLAAERMFGYDRAELLGRAVELLLPKGVNGADLRGRRKDGAGFPVEIRLSPKRPEPGSTSVVIRDATERDRSGLDGLRHGLRGQLHSIIGFSELLSEQLEGPLNERQMLFVSHILEDSQRLLALIDEVLDLRKS